MKYILIILLFIAHGQESNGQQVDSIFFHLYTDSLKKGTHNYINVDGRLSDKKWKPLTEKEILFTASFGRFEGNELILPAACPVEYIKVKATLRSRPQMSIETIIWIKKNEGNEKLPTRNDMLKKRHKRGDRGLSTSSSPDFDDNSFHTPIFAVAGLTRPAPAEPPQGRKAARISG